MKRIPISIEIYSVKNRTAVREMCYKVYKKVSGLPTPLFANGNWGKRNTTDGDKFSKEELEERGIDISSLPVGGRIGQFFDSTMPDATQSKDKKTFK